MKLRTLISTSALFTMLGFIGLSVSNRTKASFQVISYDCYHNGVYYGTTNGTTMPSCEFQHSELNPAKSNHQGIDPLECLLQKKPSGGDGGYR